MRVALLELKTPFARATVPVVLGIGVIALMAGTLWMLAAYISDNPSNNSERITSNEWTVGPVDSLAEIVAADGPLLFQEPGGDDTARSIVVDHQGEVASNGWRVYWAYPADRDARCPITQVRGDDTFIDCEGRTIAVEQLAPPDAAVFPRVDDGATLVIDFRGADPSSG